MGEPSIDPNVAGALRSRLRGPLFTVDTDPQAYEESCRIWNGMIRSRPALVARPTGTADVVECVRFARDNGLRIAAKGGGHNLAGTSMATGGLTVDLNRMRGVLVDPNRNLARVQGGCLLGDVDRETQLHGKATVLGFVSETGVAGLTLGGGFGHLSRRFGWASDNVAEIEIVLADGSAVRASAEENEDLFWAVRGAGANFGIVTSFTFRLHDVGPIVTGGMILWPAEQAEEVLALYADITSSVRRELTLALTMRWAPPAPFVPQEWHGKPIIGVIACHSGAPEQADADLAPLKSFGRPIADLIVRKPYAAQQMMLDATQPKGLHYYWKSEYLPAMTATHRDIFRIHGEQVPNVQSQIILFHVGGAIAERSAEDGVVGNRDAVYVFGAAGCWPPDDPNGPTHQSWVRTAWQAMRPHATGGVT